MFFDHFGPVTLAPETDSDVGAHPHIGLATVSYLLEGSLLHRERLSDARFCSEDGFTPISGDTRRMAAPAWRDLASPSHTHRLHTPVARAQSGVRSLITQG